MIGPLDLLNRLEDRPFKPFRIHLSDGTALDVPDPGMVIVGRNIAVVPSRFGQEDGRRIAEHWRTIALGHVVQFGDLEEAPNGRPRRRRR